jgi:hypothetical protein
MMGRYPVLTVFAWVLSGLGVLTWFFTVVFVAYVISYGNQLDNFLSSLRWLFGDMAADVVQVGAFYIVARVVISGAIGGLAFMGIGQFFHLMVDIADDTRLLRLHRDREMLESRRGR